MKKSICLLIIMLMVFQQFVVFADNFVPKDNNQKQEESLNKKEPVIEEIYPLKNNESPASSSQIEEGSEPDSEIKEIQPTLEKENVVEEPDNVNESYDNEIKKKEMAKDTFRVREDKWGTAKFEMDDDGNALIYDGELSPSKSGIPTYPSILKEAKSVTLENVIFPSDSNYLFSSLTMLKKITFVRVDTSNVTNMEYIFTDLFKLEEVYGLQTLDTSKVKNFKGMFRAWRLIKSIDVSSFDMSSAEDVSYMFARNKILEKVVLNGRGNKINESMKTTNLFQSSPKLERIEIGGDIKFTGDENLSVKKEPESVYTGKWVNESNKNVAFTDAEFMTDVPSKYPGTYVWEEVAKDSYVDVYYEDESGKKLLPTKRIVGKVGANYDVRKEGNEKINGYTLTKTPDNATGTYKNGGITVHFIYEKKAGGTIRVHHLDENNQRVAPQQDITGKKVGDSYETVPAIIEGWEPKYPFPGNATGTVTEGPQDVYYYYIKKESIRIETPEEMILSSQELIDGAPSQPTVMPDRQRISDDSLADILTNRGIKGYHSSGGKETQISEEELKLEYVGLADVPYSPTRLGPIAIKVKGHYNNLVSETKTIKVTVTDGIFQISVPEELLFKSKLSSKLNAQTDLLSQSKLVINDQRYSEDGWMITASATEFIKADSAKVSVPVSDMDLVARMKGQSDQSLIEGGISFDNQSEKHGNFDLNDKDSKLSLYLATKRSQSWAKADESYTTTINWDLGTTLKTSEANFMVPQLKKEVN